MDKFEIHYFVNSSKHYEHEGLHSTLPMISTLKAFSLCWYGHVFVIICRLLHFLTSQNGASDKQFHFRSALSDAVAKVRPKKCRGYSRLIYVGNDDK